MSMACADNWSNLPDDLLILIVKKFSVLDDYFIFTLVCKSWRNSLNGYDKPCLPLRYPFLFLSEKVAPGAIVSDGEYDSDEDYGHTTDEDEEEEEEYSGDENQEDDGIEEDQYDHNKISVGSSRGLYSLLTGNTYNIDLPEAAGRLISGTNMGWLITLGRDLQINLLHPLLRHQIPLPPMLTFPRRQDYGENYMPEDASEIFIEKFAISSKILNKDAAVDLYHQHATPSPIVMAMYGGSGCLGFARVGDKVWSDVNIPLHSSTFNDIVYHKGNFYAVDCHGSIIVFGVDDDKDGGGIRGTKIASLETKDWEKKYLVESSSGSGLLLLVRYRKEKYFKRGIPRRHKYRTIDFSVWRLDLKYSNSIENMSCTLIKENFLENEAIFIGRNSSTSVPSSDFIKPNSIYFTDDHSMLYIRKGGGHDMGIFDMNSRTIEPHYPGKSIHPISPPLWYI